ncbi:MAG: Ig-like domain-containing protein [Terriglobales bacterium]
MANHGRAGLVWFALATVVFLLVAGCNGFFVNPTLTTLTVTPLTPTITAETGTPPTCPSGSVCTVQMVANGTFSDGSTSTVAASWSLTSVTPDGALTIMPSGLVTALMPGSGTVQAASATVTGSTTVTAIVANLASIQVTPTSPSIDEGSQQQFVATGTLSGGGTVVITDSVTWASSNPCVTITNGASGGLATAQSCTASTTSDITATSGSIVSPAVVLNVTVP